MLSYLAEFLGTFVLLYVIFATNNYLAIGATLAAIVFVGGPISGGMFNPAVTLAMYYAKKMPAMDVMPYIVAQIAGALAAYVAYKMLMKR